MFDIIYDMDKDDRTKDGGVDWDPGFDKNTYKILYLVYE